MTPSSVDCRVLNCPPWTAAPMSGKRPSSVGSASSLSTNTISHALGHEFSKKTFKSPAYCSYCGDLLWGLTSQGCICERESESMPGTTCSILIPCLLALRLVCNYTTHEKCMPKILNLCTEQRADAIEVEPPLSVCFPTSPTKLRRTH